MTVYRVNENRDGIEKLDQSLTDCLSDPAKQGFFYLPITEFQYSNISDIIGLPGIRKFEHFATNQGISMGGYFSSRVLKPYGKNAYTILQLSNDMAFDHQKLGANINGSFLSMNILKIMDQGNYYLFDGSFEDAEKAILDKYEFQDRIDEDSFSKSNFLFRMKHEAKKQRRENLTAETLERISQELFSGKIKFTKEEFMREFHKYDIPS